MKFRYYVYFSLDEENKEYTAEVPALGYEFTSKARKWTKEQIISEARREIGLECAIRLMDGELPKEKLGYTPYGDFAEYIEGDTSDYEGQITGVREIEIT